MILCIETATAVCSAALCSRERIIALRENTEGRSHASLLTVFIEELLKESGTKPDMLKAVAVSKGPGSYTGLRIGVSAAKGLAYAASIPLIAIDTTLSMFAGFKTQAEKSNRLNEKDFFCPAIDARRMEIYFAIYSYNGTVVKSTGAEVIDNSSFSKLSPDSRIFFFGDGAGKIKNIIGRDNCIFDEQFLPSAAYLHAHAWKAFDEGIFEDIAYFEPFYLKDFITTKPVKKISGL
jgi:tRNA threonylcarbamoyladenosine biosynthesis protein TsaB